MISDRYRVSKDLVFAKLCEGMYEGYVRSITQFRPSSLPSGSFVPTAHELFVFY